ncbi:hypothetical protein D3C81_1928930 [compost metagenome]
MPSFLMALRFCELTVWTLRWDIWDISVTVAPAQNKRTISASRLVKRPRPSTNAWLTIMSLMVGE